MKRTKENLLERGRTVLGMLILCAGLAVGCGGRSEEDGEDGHSERGEKGGHDGHAAVRLDPEKMVELGVEVSTAGPGELVLHLPLSGTVHLNGDRVAHIVPRTPGIVQEVKRTLGDSVKEGDVLALLESAELGEAKVGLLASRQRLELGETDLARMEQIHRNTLVLLELLDSAPSFEQLRKFEGEELGENRSRLIGSYSEYVVSKATWEREKRLFDRKIASESDYLAAETGFRKAEAEYLATCDSVRFSLRRDLLAARREKQLAGFEVQSADRRLHVLGMSDPEIEAVVLGETGHSKLAWYSLRAPFEGTVVDKHITMGEMLETSESAFTIADLSRVWVDLTVYQKDLDRVGKGGQAVQVRSGPGNAGAGFISYVSPQVDEETRTAVARVLLENPDGAWRPGMFITALLEYDRARVGVLVSKAAVQTLGGEAVVFVETENGFEPRDVEIGRQNDVHIEIKSGLAVGDRYVSKGAFMLKAELGKGSFGDGHGH